MKIGVNPKYLIGFILILAIETSIAVFIKDGFIRAYFGDMLVVVLIYCFIKTFVRNNLKFLILYIFIFSVLIEMGQYFNLVQRLGLSDFMVVKIIFGTSFDIRDIVCYLAGSLGLCLFELIAKKRLITS